MKYGKATGMTIFVLGLIITIGYGLVQGFQEINFEDFDIVVTIGVISILLGIIILFITIIFEQQHGKQKMKNEIKKEDLEP